MATGIYGPARPDQASLIDPGPAELSGPGILSSLRLSLLSKADLTRLDPFNPPPPSLPPSPTYSHGPCTCTLFPYQSNCNSPLCPPPPHHHPLLHQILPFPFNSPGKLHKEVVIQRDQEINKYSSPSLSA